MPYIHSSAQPFISSGLFWLDMCGSPHTSRSFTSESNKRTPNKTRNRKFNGFFSPSSASFPFNWKRMEYKDNDGALRRIKRTKMLKNELKLKTKANLWPLYQVKRKSPQYTIVGKHVHRLVGCVGRLIEWRGPKPIGSGQWTLSGHSRPANDGAGDRAATRLSTAQNGPKINAKLIVMLGISHNLRRTS